jgi:predicted nucleic acid-binding protein
VTRFVVDANVAIKWVLPEIQSQEALRLLNNDNQLLVPDFFFSEVGNVIWKRICRKEITLEQAKRCLAQMTGTALGVYSSRLLIPQALEIAVSVQQAVYDCVYLALAVNKQCTMVTADERFYNALRNQALASYLCWIEDLA